MSSEQTPNVDVDVLHDDVPEPKAEYIPEAPEAEEGSGEAPEPEAEPQIDPRDAMIAQQGEILTKLSAALAERERANAPVEPKEDENSIEKLALSLGFGNVGADPETGTKGINMIPALAKLFAAHEAQVVGKMEKSVRPALTRIGEEMVGTKFERALAVQVQRQSPEFIRFRDAELARDAKLNALRSNEHGADVAAELIAARWRKQRAAVAKGEVRREERLSGAALQSGTPRGTSRAGTKFKINPKASSSEISRRICEAADLGIDVKDIDWTK